MRAKVTAKSRWKRTRTRIWGNKSSHSRLMFRGIDVLADVPFEFVGKIARSCAGAETLGVQSARASQMALVIVMEVRLLRKMESENLQ